MIFNNKLIYLKFLYNFFIVLSLIIFFFSTTKVFGKSFNINDIEIYNTNKNLGYGGVQKYAFQYSIDNNYNYIIMLHGDGQYAPAPYPLKASLHVV